jgi:hypothetical protein
VSTGEKQQIIPAVAAGKTTNVNIGLSYDSSPSPSSSSSNSPFSSAVAFRTVDIQKSNCSHWIQLL